MGRRRSALVVGLAVAALVVAGCGGDDDEASGTDTTTTTETTTGETTGDPGTLAGSVGPGFEISLSDSAGAEVTEVAAGRYTLEVNDQSAQHNFHISGPGVDESTGVPIEGPSSFDLDLQAGTYTFVCDPHAGSMRGSFEVAG